MKRRIICLADRDEKAQELTRKLTSAHKYLRIRDLCQELASGSNAR
jgi:hypothetical protein